MYLIASWHWWWGGGRKFSDTGHSRWSVDREDCRLTYVANIAKYPPIHSRIWCFKVFANAVLSAWKGFPFCPLVNFLLSEQNYNKVKQPWETLFKAIAVGERNQN